LKYAESLFFPEESNYVFESVLDEFERNPVGKLYFFNFSSYLNAISTHVLSFDIPSSRIG